MVWEPEIAADVAAPDRYGLENEFAAGAIVRDALAPMSVSDVGRLGGRQGSASRTCRGP